MRKTISVLILGVACMSATAQTASNLLPNGDFSNAAQLSGWTSLGSGTMQFSTADANGNSASGSMILSSGSYFQKGTAISSCFAVSPGKAFSIGGQVKGSSTIGLSFYGAETSFACSTYATANCTGNVLDSPMVSMVSSQTSFMAFPTTNGTTNAMAVSANCTVNAGVLPNSVATQFDTGVGYFDNLFFTPAITLDGYLSGSWYDPSQSGQGFDLDFTDQQNQLVAYWFSFTPDGKSPMWLYAQGTYDSSSNAVTIPVAIVSGTRFSPNFNPADVQRTLWGTLTFTFSDCNHGNVSWNSTVSGYGSGSFPIVRLTRIRGTACPQ
jgi:hypothetical protein